ncbi:type IV pilus biogenesis protein PilM, partial [Candidatus Ichthyocystis hellenicum]|uniref:type IV pilus biogenesis protein PilM n=2 Tax=Candidatus Ichthyocystis TaxID=2929841 RepID=UPI000B87A22E
MEIFKKTLLGVLGIETTYTRALGIDIGSSAVKFSEVSSSESGMRIESYHIEPIPDEVVYMGKIEDHLAVVDAIKRGLASNNFRAKNNASLAIAYSMATIREMTIFGNLSQEELAVRAYSEAVHVTGGSVHDLAIDFCEDKSPDKDKRKFLLAISKKENVDDIVYLLKDSGITPRIIDVELYAFHTMCIRFLELNPPLLKKSNIYLFVEFGHSKTLFLFMRGQEVIFAKEQSFGFVSLSREVKSELDLDYASAQRMIAGIDKAQERYSEIILPEFISECCSVVYRILQLFYTTTS